MDDVGDGLHVRYSSIVLEFLLRFLVRIVIYSFFAIFIVTIQFTFSKGKVGAKVGRCARVFELCAYSHFYFIVR